MTITRHQINRSRKVKLAILTPAFNEHQNLPVLHQRLNESLHGLDVDWFWIVIDDHSRDGTFEVLEELAAKDPRVSALRLTRNVGSHVALKCALDYCEADCAVVLAADLQDPPETIPALLKTWQNGAQMV